jgi:FAD:protein FMN transferase
VSALRISARLVVSLALLGACTPAPTSPTPDPRKVDEPVKQAPAPEPAREAPPVRKDGTIYAEAMQMGTRFSINLWLGDRPASEGGAAIEAALAEIERVEQIASEWRPTSELSQLNADAGGPMRPLSPELFELLQRSKVIAEATGGAFDPSFYGVGQLWKFDPGATPPKPEEISAKLHLVDWRAIELDPNTGQGRLQKPGMKLGLGAIAKGYGVDRAALVLVQRGFNNHIVEGGGDTYVSGTKAGKPWMVGIQRPDRPGSLAAIPSSDRAIVTSGDYQRFFEFQGKRYAHILDPATGWPIPEERSAQSVTVLAKDATDADAYATAVAVMGPEKGMAFVEAHPDLEAVIINRAGEVMVSKDLQPTLVWPPTKAPAGADDPARAPAKSP